MPTGLYRDEETKALLEKYGIEGKQAGNATPAREQRIAPVGDYAGLSYQDARSQAGSIARPERSGPTGLYKDDKTRQLLAKYGLADYTDEEWSQLNRQRYEMSRWDELMQGRQDALQGIQAQLGTNSWSDWQGDSGYREELQKQIRELQDYIGETASDDASYRSARELLADLQRWEKSFQSREDFYGQFSNETEWQATQDTLKELAGAWKSGKSYADVSNAADAEYTEKLRQFMGMDKESDYETGTQGFTYNIETSNTKQGGKPANVDDLDEYVRELEYGIEYGMGRKNGQMVDLDDADIAAYQQELNRIKQYRSGMTKQYQQKSDEARQKALYAQYAKSIANAFKYADLPQREDWNRGVYEGREKLNALMQEVEADRSERAAEVRHGNTEVAGLSDTELAGEDYYTYRVPNDSWKQDQKDLYSYLLNRDKAEAFEYAVGINRSILATRAEEANKQFYDWSYEHEVLGPMAGTASRVLTSPLGLWDYMGNLVQHANTGLVMPRGEISPRDVANSLAGGAAQRLNDYGTLPEDWAIIGGKGWGDAYQLGNSIAESLAWGKLSKAMMAAGGSEAMAGMVTNLGFFGNAASETTQEALKRGATDEQALALGFFSGLAEAAGETLSVEHLIHLDNPVSFKKTMLNILKQAGVEGSEEGFTTLMNTFADAAIMKDKSELQTKVREYMLQGMSRSEAEKRASKEWFNDLGADILGGILSGGVSSALSMGGRNFIGSVTKYQGDAQGLVDVAKLADKDTDASRLAARYQERINSGKKLTNRQAEKLQMSTQEALDSADRPKLVQAAAQRLREQSTTRMSDAEVQRTAQQIVDRIQNGEKSGKWTALQENVYREMQMQLDDVQVPTGNWMDTSGLKRTQARAAVNQRLRTVETKDGERVNVKSAVMEGGKLQLTVEQNGKPQTVSLDELKLDDYQKYTLNTLTRILGKDAAAAFNEMTTAGKYGRASSVEEYAVAFATIRDTFGRSTDTEKAERAALVSPLRKGLTDAQVRYAIAIGQQRAKENTDTGHRTAKGTGKVSFEGGTLNDGTVLKGVKDVETVKRSKDYRAVKAIAKALGVDVVMFESEADENGNLSGAQGAYQDGVVYLDWNAGMKNIHEVGSRMLLRTMAHELTHFIQENSPENYAELKAFITKTLTDKTGRRFNDLVEEKMDAQPNLSYDEAVDEVVADSCETMLRDSQAVQELMQEHKTLWQSIRDFVKKFLQRVTAEYEGAILLQDSIDELREIWDLGLRSAVESRTDTETGVSEVSNSQGETVAVTSQETGGMQLSIRTYNEGGKQALRQFLNQQVEKGALTKKEAAEIRSQIDTLYRVCKDYDNGKYAPFSAWSNASVVTYDGRPVFSVVKANGEYKLNLDFSLVCKKRRTLDAVFNEMISLGIMDDFDMVQESIAKINDIIRENGFETACGLCFVDSKRYRQGMIADAFVGMYNMQVMSLVKSGAGQKVDYFNYGGDQTKQNSGHGIDTLPDDQLDWTKIDKILKTEKKTTVRWKIANYLKNNPSARRRVMRGDFMSTAGFDAVKAQNPELLSLYNSKKGAGGPKAAQSDVQYLNEIINQNMFNQKSAYEVGGVRIQSFSDYVGRLVFDYVQMVADLSAKKLPAHSYTKEFMYALQFGLTGIKINMSLVPEIIKDGVAPGLDANGNYAWKDGQSFGSTVYDNKGKRLTAAEGFELAKRIQNADGYSKNCGTIAVGVSDEHIRKMLDDPEIRMIIPYHTSSLNHIVAAMMNIDQYTDYTLQQNTRERKGSKWVNISKSQEFNFNEALQRLGDAKAAANEYLAWCRENGFKPKFDQFADNANYYKLLEDFSCYDKDGVTNTPLSAVQMKFPGEGDAFGSMSELIEQGLEEDAILQAKQEQAVPEIVKQIQAVLPEFEGTVRERNAKKKSKKASKAQLSARDGIENLSPEEYSNSTANLGYHAGDLGKAEHLNIQGRYRGTGHFGTGTYFVGEEEKVTKDSHYGKRPQHAVDFSDYNLFKVRSDKTGYQLHDALRIIDGGIKREWIRPALDNQFNIINPTGYYDLAKSKYGEDWAHGDNLLNAMLEYAADNGISVKTLDEYKADEGFATDDADAAYYYEDYVKDTVKEEIGKVNAEYREFANMVFDLHILPGFTNGKIFSALNAVADYQDVTPRTARADSYATVFMKAMGYDGVDVRGTRLDNTEYGSVIYDVKPQTVVYSMRGGTKTDAELLKGAYQRMLKDKQWAVKNLEAAQQKALEKFNAEVERYQEKEKEVTDALDELDKLVQQGADRKEIQKQRSRVSAKEEQMAKALERLTKAKGGSEIQSILQREREIQRQRTREQIRENIDRRDLRQRINKLWKDLNARVTNPSEKKRIPVELMQQTLDVLEALNMDTSREGSKSGEKLREKLSSLRTRYEELQNDPDFRRAAVYDTQVAEYLTNMIAQVGDTPINKMRVGQLETVYATLQAMVYTANRALKLKLGEQELEAYEVSKAMTRETRSVTKPKTGAINTWLNAQLSPERMFNRLGGYSKNSYWSRVYGMLNEGQLKQTRLQVEGSLIFEDLMEKENEKNFQKLLDPKNTVDIGLKDENGEAVLLTHGMMISLYMHLQNEQNIRHLAYGGLTIPALKDYYNGKKVRGSERSIRVGGALQEIADINDRLHETEDANEIAELEQQRDEAALKAIDFVEGLREEIDKQLTDYDRQWIAASRELFDGFSKRELNRTTLEVYGIKRANVENYYPIWVDGDFLNTPFESVAKDLSLENAGFMKERIDSSKPIRLADVTDVTSSQIRKVAQYCGLMPAVRSFNKVWGKTQTGYRDSLQKAVHETFGQSGVKYVENLMADLNGARGGQESALGEFLNRMRGHMAQASLTMSLRVAMGQTASYPTAAAVVGWGPLMKALAHGGRNNTIISRADQELIRKWSPLLYYRMKGYSTTELGDIAGMNDKFSRVWKKARWLTGWIQAMDGATVGRLWYAAEYYVQDHNKALVKGTDAYYEAVAKVFNDIVEKTQPDYTTMQRPDILRNPNALVKQLTMFLTQRLQNFNILYDAAATYSKYKADLKAGRNGVTAEDVRQAGIATRRAATSQIAAAATITAFKFLADAILHSMKGYRDDDEELTAQSVSLELLDMFFDSLAGNVLGGGEVYDLIESKVFGKTYYGIEVSGLSTVTDMVDAFSSAFDHALKGELSWKDADKLARNLATVAGIPYPNAKKFVQAGIWYAQDVRNGEWLWESNAGISRSTGQQASRLYRAYTNGDGAKVKQILEEVPEDKQKDVYSAVRKLIREQQKSGELNVYEAMRQMKNYGGATEQVMADYIKDLYKAGALPQADAKKYLQLYAGRTMEAAAKTVTNVDGKQASGVDYNDIDDMFKVGKMSAVDARKALVGYGLDQDTANMKVEYWSYQKQNPGTSMTSEDRFETYWKKFKPLGMTAKLYDDFFVDWNAVQGTDKNHDGKADSGSKKQERIAIIDALPLTKGQKDALFNMYWKTGLDQAPWNKR